MPRLETNRLTTPCPSVSRRMRNTPQRDNPCELALRSILHRLGLRFRVHRRLTTIPRRTVDILFPKERLAVFVDGCFWHGCPEHGTMPKANHDWWQKKLAANQMRDRDTDDRLTADGWLVIRVWEHEDPVQAARAIRKAVLDRRKQ